MSAASKKSKTQQLKERWENAELELRGDDA